MIKQRASVFALAARVLPLLVMAVGCGGKESTASRSAAAYDAAQRKGVPVGHSAHEAKEGHAAGERAGESSPPDAAASPAMSGMDHSSMPGMDEQAPPRTDPHVGMDHSKMPGMSPSGAAMDHSSMPNMAGMDHSKMPGMSHDMQMPTPSPEPVSVSAESGQPSATLRADPLDEPPATSIRDAARSAAMATEMSGDSHAMSHGTYRHVDAGRDIPAPQPSPHQEHHH